VARLECTLRTEDDPGGLDDDAFAAAWRALPREDQRAVLDYWRSGRPEEGRATVRPIFERLADEYRARGGRVPA
jgi:hypothetical protein